MKPNKIFTLVINWTLLLLLPIWSIPFMLFAIAMEIHKRQRTVIYETFIKGDKYYWGME